MQREIYRGECTSLNSARVHTIKLASGQRRIDFFKRVTIYLDEITHLKV